MNNNVIEIENVDFGYKKTGLNIKKLNLCLKRKSIYGFLGANGSGKTTTIKLILGLLKPEKGNIKIFGRKIDNKNIDIFKNIGVLIEKPSLYEHLTCYDNLKISAFYFNIIEYKKKIEKVTNLVGLDYLSKKKVSEFSLGMKQRLGLALALLNEPELLILDEPLSGLDPNGIADMRNLILRINKDFNTTIFFSSHQINEVEKLCTHIGILKNGNLIFDNNINETFYYNSFKVYSSNNEKSIEIIQNILGLKGKIILENDYIKINESDSIEHSEIIKLLSSNDIYIYKAIPQTLTLEDFYLMKVNEK